MVSLIGLEYSSHSLKILSIILLGFWIIEGNVL